MRRLDADDLRRAIRSVLSARGLSDPHADQVSETLVSTSLDGIDTHGIRLLPTYVRELEGGRANPTPRFGIHSPLPALAVLDADHALGIVAGHEAMRLAIGNARRCGVGLVVVKNSNHFGAAGQYARLASREGLIGFACSNADALVAPFGGAEPLNGTNPLAMSAPGLEDDGFHLDMATSQVSYSRIRDHQRAGRALEPGWAQRADGTDASGGGDVHALQPLGGYKGQGLAMMVQLLCSVLAGMPADADLTHLYDPPYDRPRQIGHCFLCVEVGACGDPAELRRRTSGLLDRFRTGEVLVPGDLERAARSDRLARGVPVDDPVWELLEPYVAPGTA